MMPEPYRSLRESNLFLAAGCCRSQDLVPRKRHPRDFSSNAFVRFLSTTLLSSLSLVFRHVLLVLSVFPSIRDRYFFVFIISASGVFRRAIPPRDDSPEPSSILLYIPYVTFTMGSKEARNGRPVIELNSSEFRSVPGARSILFYSPRLEVRRHPADVRTISRYFGTCPCHNLVSRMRCCYVIRRASERS